MMDSFHLGGVWKQVPFDSITLTQQARPEGDTVRAKVITPPAPAEPAEETYAVADIVRGLTPYGTYKLAKGQEVIAPYRDARVIVRGGISTLVYAINRSGHIQSPGWLPDGTLWVRESTSTHYKASAA